jgi:hypothetical protein
VVVDRLGLLEPQTIAYIDMMAARVSSVFDRKKARG